MTGLYCDLCGGARLDVEQLYFCHGDYRMDFGSVCLGCSAKLLTAACELAGQIKHYRIEREEFRMLLERLPAEEEAK